MIRNAISALLSLLLVVVTIYLVMNRGGDVMSKAVETTRKVAAMWDLRNIRDMLLMSRVLQEPDAVREWSDEDFVDFLAEHLRSRATRYHDPAMDPWDMPYVLVPLEDDPDWVVLSTGPNREPDLCVFEGSGGDDVCLLIEAAEISH